MAKRGMRFAPHNVIDKKKQDYNSPSQAYQTCKIGLYLFDNQTCNAS